MHSAHVSTVQGVNPQVRRRSRVQAIREVTRCHDDQEVSSQGTWHPRVCLLYVNLTHKLCTICTLLLQVCFLARYT